MPTGKTGLQQLARQYHVLVKTDNQFQRQARILQSIWREEQQYPFGKHQDQPLGSRLPMPWAKETLANYLTANIRQVVLYEIQNKNLSGKLFAEPRIYNNLLSSQPLCFNLFAELQQDLNLATAVFRKLTSDRVSQVTGIEFEHSPGRGNARYTGDKSAFDVYVTYQTPAGGAGFIGIEVKYHENLAVTVAKLRDRHDEIAVAMQCFDPASLALLKTPPLEQIWRDHLLAGSLLQSGAFEDGFFVFLYPQANLQCAGAVRDYSACLKEMDTFMGWTLETVLTCLKEITSAKWIDDFFDRYLRFDRIEQFLKAMNDG